MAWAPAHLVVVLDGAQCAQRLPVSRADLVLVALHEAQQRLVPHHRHLPLVVLRPTTRLGQTEVTAGGQAVASKPHAHRGCACSDGGDGADHHVVTVQATNGGCSGVPVLPGVERTPPDYQLLEAGDSCGKLARTPITIPVLAATRHAVVTTVPAVNPTDGRVCCSG
jgi:hypothetical protein